MQNVHRLVRERVRSVLKRMGCFNSRPLPYQQRCECYAAVCQYIVLIENDPGISAVCVLCKIRNFLAGDADDDDDANNSIIYLYIYSVV